MVSPKSQEIPAASTEHPDVGRILGSYQVLGLLGEGGMGLVYLAEHRQLGRKVAIKRLKDRYRAQEEALDRFFAEARAVNRINHPNIVEITDFSAEEDAAYYVMELLRGETLSDVIKREGPLPLARALDIGHQTAAALGAAHDNGMVHRDIKPSNIYLIERDGREDFVKLLDFGVMQLMGLEANESPSASSSKGNPLGTPLYMSPEQASGREVDHRSDLYSLGAVIYQMIGGKPPFQATTMPELVYKHLRVEPVPLTELPETAEDVAPQVNRVVMRAMHKDPDFRFQSAAELMESIEAAGPAAGVILSDGEPPILTGRPRVIRWGLIAALIVLVLGAGSAIAWWAGRSPPEKSNKARAAAPMKAMDAPMKRRADRVAVRIESTPPGAEVSRLEPTPSVLGVTPLRLRVKRSDTPWKLVARLEGHRDKRFGVRLDQGDWMVNLVLESTAAPPPPMVPSMGRPMTAPRRTPMTRPVARPPPMRQRRRGGMADPSSTIDPFAK